MKIVCEYQLPFIDSMMTGNRIELYLPKDAPVLSVQVRDGVICMWTLSDPSEPRTKRSFSVLRSGDPVNEKPDEWFEFLGTVQVPESSTGNFLVFHCFEIHTSDIMT